MDDDRFEVADGNLKLKAGTTLDFETWDGTPIDVTITASGDGDSDTHTVSVSINDVNEAPTITITPGATVPNPEMTVSSSTVDENAMGSSVPPLALIEITDEDAADATTGQDAVDMITLSGGMEDYFEVKLDPEMGLWVALKADASLDHEGSGGAITVTVTYTDSAGNAVSADLEVTVNDVNEGPMLEAADGAVDENADGAMAGAVTASDPDAGDTHTYEVSDDRFEVADGMLKLKDGMSLDYETESSVMVTITVTDSGGLSASADVTVMVNNVNEGADVNGEVDDMTFVGGTESSMDVDLKALFSDPDGDGLTYRLSDNAPDWLTLSVTTTGSGDSQTITGTISGTPSAGAEGEVADVSIVASDDDGAEAHAMFDLIIDATNDAPDRLELRVTDEDGLVIRTTEANVDENAMGVEFGSIYLRDPDDARHPHGQHEFSFSDDRFEVSGGMLKLKDDASLDREADGNSIVLTVTATDMAEGDAAESISLDITITIGNVDTGSSEGPSLVEGAEIDDVAITVDEDLREDDVDAGQWLDETPGGLAAAFTDPDGDTLTYSLGSGAPSWLQIDEDSGKLTNAEMTLPARGVYDITVVASDDDGNTASASFMIAVALSDSPNVNDDDNEEPDIRNIDEEDYQEGSGGQLVASFDIRDEDLDIAPHHWGVLTVTFTAMQEDDNGDLTDVSDRFRLEKGDVGSDTAEYQIYHKTAAQLAMDDDGMPLDEDDVPDPIDYEDGDEIHFTIEVEDGAMGDGQGMDDRGFTIDILDVDDQSPVYVGNTEVSAGADMTSTVSVAQEADRDVIILQLDEVWTDPDTDVDDLRFDVEGEDDLPDWIKVYGPDRWEDIYENRRNDVTEDDGDDYTDLRDRDEVIVIVMDRSSASTSSNTDGASFTITADDGTTEMATQTIMIEVDPMNVDPEDGDDAIMIGGDRNSDDKVIGTGSLEMKVNLDLDPNIAGGKAPYLVLYTWSVSSDETDDGNATNGPENVEIISVSTTQQLLMLGVPGTTPGTMVRNPDYVGQTITAKVEVFEYDAGNDNKITLTWMRTDTVEVADAAQPGTPEPTATSVSLGDITTDTDGINVTVTTAGDASQSGAVARIESSTDKSSGSWQTEHTLAAFDTTDGTEDLSFNVDADGNGTNGDGGGLYYRVVYVYQDEDGEDQEYIDPRDPIQLGSVATDPADITLITPTTIESGATLRVNNLTANVTVQWQIGVDEDESGTVDPDEWSDLDDEVGKTLTLTDDHAGNSVRAKLTHMSDEDNPSHVTWIDYSAVAAVAALPTSPNNTPTRTQETYWIEVNLNDDDDEGTATGDVSGFFFDADGDDMTFSLVGPGVDDAPGGGVQDGLQVYRSGNDDQILTLNKDTGAITYYTSNGMSHGYAADGTPQADPIADGAGNLFVVSVQASDGKPDTADDTTDDVTVNVRVNVAPAAIHLNAAAIEDDATETATYTGFSFAETDDFDAATAGISPITLDVQDLNFAGNNTTDAHSYGTHTLTVSDNRFEVERVAGSSDMSQWTLSVRDGAKFDFETDDDDDDTAGTQVVVKVTATDGGGKKTEGYLFVTITDVTTDDPQDNQPSTTGADTGGVMTTGGNAGDDNGAGDPPGDGGLWIEEQHYIDVDLLEEFVISIDDIDVA